MSNDGDTIALGSLDDSGGTNRGAAYIFTRSGSTWSQQAKLENANEADFDLFGSGGRVVVVDGATVVVVVDGATVVVVVGATVVVVVDGATVVVVDGATVVVVVDGATVVVVVDGATVMLSCVEQLTKIKQIIAK